MTKALLISILAATIAIPFLAARGTLKEAVQKSAVATGVFCVLYWLGLLYVYPQLPKPDTRIMQQQGGQAVP